MCHLASHRASPAGDGIETSGSSPRALRPRWIAGAAAVAIAGLAAATLLDRPAERSTPVAQRASVGAPATMETTLVPITAPATRGALLPDDDVPTSTGSSQTMLGHCDHGA